MITAKWNSILICSNIDNRIAGYQWYIGGSTIQNANDQFYYTNKQAGIYLVETLDKDGCKNKSNSITINGTKSLSIHPNPASSSFDLRIADSSLSGLSNEKVLVRLFSDSGLKVMEFQTENRNDQILKTISVSNLQDGVYLLHVTVGSEDIYTAKVVVKK